MIFPSGGTIKDMVVNRPPEMVPLDAYMASETYSGAEPPATPKEVVAVKKKG